MPGDTIVTITDSGERVNDEVLKTHKVIASEFFVINANTRVTPEHPFLTNRGWIDAQDLAVGDLLIGPEGSDPVRSIEKQIKGVRVYNLSVGGVHTFVVNGNIVHNKPPDPGG